jgi:hypothetical protein
MMETSVENHEPASAAWNAPKLVVFRFFLVFLILLCATPLVAGVALPLPWYLSAYNAIAHVVVPWFGLHVLRLSTPITVFSNARGDTTYDWVHIGILALLAIVATAAWSLVDRRRRRYEALEYWLRVVLLSQKRRRSVVARESGSGV